MKAKVSMFILDYLYGVLKRYKDFLWAYCFILGAYVLLVNGSINYKWLLAVREVFEEMGPVESLVQNGTLYELVFLYFVVGWIFTSAFKMFILYSEKKGKDKVYSDFAALVSVYFLSTLIIRIVPEVTLEYIIGVSVVFYAYKGIYRLVNRLFTSKYKKYMNASLGEKDIQNDIPDGKCDEVVTDSK